MSRNVGTEYPHRTDVVTPYAVPVDRVHARKCSPAKMIVSPSPGTARVNSSPPGRHCVVRPRPSRHLLLFNGNSWANIIMREKNARLGRFARLFIGGVGVTMLLLFALGTYVTWTIKGKYFRDYSWPSVGWGGVIWLTVAFYLMFAAFIGNWRLRRS